MAKPIFCATHPRACSTAFERVFMTRKDLNCIHEPFGTAFYYGPERMSVRYEKDEKTRNDSGYRDTTFATIFDEIEREQAEGKRIFIKDIIYSLVPPDQQATCLAPSLHPKRRGIGTESKISSVNGSMPPFPFDTEAEPGNPTVVPDEMLRRFHFTFLIRDPHSSIPSYYRCTIPPLDEMTGWYEFYPNEAGYIELRRVFDYLQQSGQVGAERHNGVNGSTNGAVNGTVNGDFVNGSSNVDICVVDADDLLDDPEGIIKAYCKSVGLEYDQNMLNWDNEEDQKHAKKKFEKWKGFHEDAIDSKDLKPRAHKKAAKTESQWNEEWQQKYGHDAAKLIRGTVDENMDHYHYLKQFSLKAER